MQRPRPYLIAAAMACAMATGCAAPRHRMDNPDVTVADERARAVHVLNRLTFGPRPGDVERVLAQGVDRWVAAQLEPRRIADSGLAAALSHCPVWTQPMDNAAGLLPLVIDVPTADGRSMTRIGNSSISLIARDSARPPFGVAYLENGRVMACRLTRMETSEQQLLEVMADFWHNHFSLYSRTVPTRASLVAWDRETIRPNALGRFRDLLGAVARSPAMLAYLDNDVNGGLVEHPTVDAYVRGIRVGLSPGVRPGLNENFARELLELHTLGVDGGYTQADVIDVARAFSGWTHTGRRRGCMERQVSDNFMTMCRDTKVLLPVFDFDSAMHDAGAKRVLGHDLPAGRGMEDGEKVLDVLAAHPSTARFIARKLAIRFVSDAPPEALVDRAAETFLRTRGDIRAVMRTIVTSAEFRSPEVYGAKTKSPQELVLGMRRALAAPVDTAAEVIDLLLALGQPPFGYPTPDGWPETARRWMNAGALLARLQLAVDIGEGNVPSIPLDAWPAWRDLVGASYVLQVDGAIAALLHGTAAPRLRAALLDAAPPPTDEPAARERALRHIVSVVLGSPEFQRR